MQNLHLLEYTAEAFWCNVHHINAWQSRYNSGCDGVRFPLHIGWNSRDVSMASMHDYVKESVSFIYITNPTELTVWEKFFNPFGAKQSCGYLLEKSYEPAILPYAIYPLNPSDDMIGLHTGLDNLI